MGMRSPVLELRGHLILWMKKLSFMNHELLIQLFGMMLILIHLN